ncbi:MAG: hypothetical protein UY77_C0002G0018 [Candidatus Uhrbacteria bacterium GW2011_GWA2_53_10]|uniref:Uncharacterized protein n=1 Tax=Candidatus Uhrbacteria bacterium GW2011_GWA2_53_10 TaxID=1618980 RepID=A0A0G1XQW4_9BACT|nr:MAG: hypothetical protein UY77_C0002G0018 [Candidatus Uhrbacteria bacterium GW2011_GWA2_53_10]
MVSKKTVLIVPPNDPEAVLISQIAKKLEIPRIKSNQPHGASLDKEPKILQKIREGGWKRVVVVEMPGPKTEKRLREKGIEVVIIDHHRYDRLDRAVHPKTGKLLPSSLEQFLKLFRITDRKLKAAGFDPKLVKAIGLMDRGYVWELMKVGYTKAGIRKVIEYQSELMHSVRGDMRNEEKKNQLAREAWEKREVWKKFFIVRAEQPIEIRSRISLIVALEVGKPTPLIIEEAGRGFIYVQESDYAIQLFKKFGGFTFGMDRNWGYRNQGKAARVTVEVVQKFLSFIL